MPGPLGSRPQKERPGFSVKRSLRGSAEKVEVHLLLLFLFFDLHVVLIYLNNYISYIIL